MRRAIPPDGAGSPSRSVGRRRPPSGGVLYFAGMERKRFIVGIQSGGSVRVRSENGEAIFRCVEGKVPQGMIFVPYGPPTCHLMGQDTDGTGMPTSKGWEVEVEPITS